MAHYMMFDLFDRLNDAPGTLPIRRELADRARGYLQELSSAPRAPVEVRAEAAIGYMQLAGIEGLFAAGSLGERQQAERSLQRAAALLTEADESTRRHPQWRYALGRLRLFEGFRAGDQGDGPAAGLLLLQEAVRLLREAAAELPENVELATDLWQARLTMADMFGGLSDPAAQLAVAREAIADYQAAPALLDRSEKAPLLLARSHKQAGDALYWSQGAAASLDDYRQAEAILVAENARRPRRSRTLMELMHARWDLGSVLAELGQRDAGLALYDQAILDAQLRLLIEPDHDGLRRMHDLLGLERAGLHAQAGRHGEAVAATQANLASRRAAMEARPGDQVAERNYLAGLRPAGDVFWSVGDEERACDHYRQAQEGYAGFAARFNLAPRVVATELAGIASRLGRCRR